MNKKYVVIAAVVIIGIVIFVNIGIVKNYNENIGQNLLSNIDKNSSISHPSNTGRHLSVSINETVAVQENP